MLGTLPLRHSYLLLQIFMNSETQFSIIWTPVLVIIVASSNVLFTNKTVRIHKTNKNLKVKSCEKHM